MLGGLSEGVPPEEPPIKERSRTLPVPFLSALSDHDGIPSTENISVITYLSQVEQCLLVHAAFLKVDLRGITDLLDDDVEHRALWNDSTLGVSPRPVFHSHATITTTAKILIGMDQGNK